MDEERLRCDAGVFNVLARRAARVDPHSRFGTNDLSGRPFQCYVVTIVPSFGSLGSIPRDIVDAGVRSASVVESQRLRARNLPVDSVKSIGLQRYRRPPAERGGVGICRPRRDLQRPMQGGTSRRRPLLLHVNRKRVTHSAAYF